MTFLTEVEELRRSTNNKMSVYFLDGNKVSIRSGGFFYLSCNHLMADKGYQDLTVAQGG